MITHNININDAQLLDKLPKIEGYQLFFKDKFQDLSLSDEYIALSELIDQLDHVNLCLFRCINNYRMILNAFKDLPNDFFNQPKQIRLYQFLLLQDTVALLRSVYLVNCLLDIEDPSILPIRKMLDGTKDYEKFKNDVSEYRNFFDHWGHKLKVEDGKAEFAVKRFLNINNQFVNFKKGKQSPFFNDVDRFLGLMSNVLETTQNG